MLSSHFVGLRKEVQQIERDNDERSSIPITIRFVNFLLCYLFPSRWMCLSSVILNSWMELIDSLCFEVPFYKADVHYVQTTRSHRPHLRSRR